MFLGEMGLENSGLVLTGGLLSFFQVSPPKWEREDAVFPKLIWLQNTLFFFYKSSLGFHGIHLSKCCCGREALP